MSEPPRAVLSEHFEARLRGRRLIAAVFTTFCLEVGFFESEVLPVFLDLPLSHDPRIRLLQLEEQLRELPGAIEVYYDQRGLLPEGGGSRLDVRWIPIRHPTGFFHPKNVLVLVEELEPDKHGHRARALLCGCASANLTRAGWWENVEVAHVEEIPEAAHTSLRDPLRAYLAALRRAGEHINTWRREEGPSAVDALRDFLRGTTQREHLSADGVLHPQYHDGNREPLLGFLEERAGRALHGLHLEVISPYFDDTDVSAPLTALQERFSLASVRVLLPRNEHGEALCREGLHAWLRDHPGWSWGALPEGLIAAKNGKRAAHRTVHAKVYRFFEPKRGGRELLYVGSPNLTSAGCRPGGRSGNWESGMLVEVTSPSSRPGWWLTAMDRTRPTAFAPRPEEGGEADRGSSLLLSFDWRTSEASACWADDGRAGALEVRHGRTLVLRMAAGLLEPRAWMALSAEEALRLSDVLRSTSLLEVCEDGRPSSVVLVQEEGSSHRPSVLRELTAAEILRYWALLSLKQRADFLEARAGEGEGTVVVRAAPLAGEPSLFDRFSGVFHAFDCLRDEVTRALEQQRPKIADARLFGRRFDSLRCLLEQVHRQASAGQGERVEPYVTMLCAVQLLGELRRAFPEYHARHRRDLDELERPLAVREELRRAIAADDPTMPRFLEWFERWFLRRAAALREAPP